MFTVYEFLFMSSPDEADLFAKHIIMSLYHKKVLEKRVLEICVFQALHVPRDIIGLIVSFANGERPYHKVIAEEVYPGIVNHARVIFELKSQNQEY